SDDGGTTWTWSPITLDSTVDNLRPIIPLGAPDVGVVLWLRGTYSNYQDYDLDVVAYIEGRSQPDGVNATASPRGSMSARYGVDDEPCAQRSPEVVGLRG